MLIGILPTKEDREGGTEHSIVSLTWREDAKWVPEWVKAGSKIKQGNWEEDERHQSVSEVECDWLLSFETSPVLAQEQKGREA